MRRESGVYGSSEAMNNLRIMKRPSCSDSLGAMISIYPSAEDKCSGGSTINANSYDRGFKSILHDLEDEDCIEESCRIAEKKRRLTADQVKALEKNFEVENKLEPERKAKLAQELGLQPRQVAVWFQNRRARWKTKQLEKDYSLLKANYEALKLNIDALHHDNEVLSTEIRELKVKLQVQGGEKADSICPIKEEMGLSESPNKVSEQNQISGAPKGSDSNSDHDPDHYNCERSMFGDLKDRSSDSDCSVILNDANSPNGAISSVIIPQQQQEQMMTVSPFTSSFRYDCPYSMSSSSSSINCLPLENSKILTNTQKAYHQFLKMEEHSFLNAEEPCNFFSDDQAPTLSWYCPDQWN